MSVNQKKKIFGNIAALKTLNEGYPKLKTTSSLSSIDNGGDSLGFLSDLIKSLKGYEELVKTTNDILTDTTKKFNTQNKKILKSEIKSTINCNTNPKIPDKFKSNGEGILIPIKNIDISGLLKTNPTSDTGKLLYFDITSDLLKSKDLNTFLYQVIQNHGQFYSWGKTTYGSDILQFKFVKTDPTNQIPNNSLIVKLSEDFNGEFIEQFNSAFIDSLEIIEPMTLINSIVDLNFGSITTKTTKTKKQLENEEKINTIIDCIINSDEDDIIDNSYFEFSNEQIYKQEERAKIKKTGIQKLDCCNKVASTINSETMVSFVDEYNNTASLIEKKKVITNYINSMTEEMSSNVENDSDRYSLRLSFIQSIINGFTKSIVNTLLSPKVILLYHINNAILNNDVDYEDSVDFVRKNKTLFKNIVKQVSTIIISILLKIILKDIALLVNKSKIKQRTEKNKNRTAQIASLIGVGPSKLKKILEYL